MIDSMHYYEPCIYHSYLRDAIAGVSKGSRYHETAVRLGKVLEHFYELEPEMAPADSLLQEFIG